MDLIELRERTSKMAARYGMRQIPVDDIDDALRNVGRIYIQPAAKKRFDAHYRTAGEERVPLSDVTNEPVYRLSEARDITDHESGYYIPLLDQAARHLGGVGISGDDMLLFGIAFGRLLRLTFERKLTPLGDGPGQTTIPEIEIGWHELYVLGAVADLTKHPDADEQFQSLLKRFEVERQREILGPAGFVVRRRLGD